MQKKNFLRRCLHCPRVLFGGVLLGLLLLLVAVGFFATPYDPYEMDTTATLQFFSAEHPLGTDQFGRDILSRMMVGARYSVGVGAAAVLIGFVIGSLLGAVAGYFGGKVDELVMKLVEVQMAFPGILLALMLIAVVGTGLGNTVLALGVMAVPRFARITRSSFVKNRDAEFVLASRARGAGHLRIVVFHLFPHVVPDFIVTASLGFASAVMSEAGLSYLGLGLPPPIPSFGKMLSEAQDCMLQAGWYVLLPAAFLTLLVLSFHLLGDGLQEVMDHERA